MSNSLHWIQTFAKVGKIVCKVLFILCIVGAVGSLIGLISVAVLGAASILDLGFLSEERGENFFWLSIVECLQAIITCVGMAILTRMGEGYCEHELEAGTPFTEEGAHELHHFGIVTIIVSITCSLASSLALGFVFLLSGTWFDTSDLSSVSSVGMGLLWLLLALIFRHGAELRAQIPPAAQEKSTENEEEATQETVEK